MSRRRRAGGVQGLGRLRRTPALGEPDHVGQRGEIAQLEIGIASDSVGLPDGGKHLRLLDGIDAQVCFEIQVQS